MSIKKAIAADALAEFFQQADVSTKQETERHPFFFKKVIVMRKKNGQNS